MNKLQLFLALCIIIPVTLWSQNTPNILFILADDMGYSDLSCYGSEISTPNLDSLAYQGIRFRQFYNNAKCEPSRTEVMSGHYWQDCGLKIKVDKYPTIAEVLQSAGYRTYAVGKWHLNGTPTDRGFHRFFGHLDGGTNYFGTAGNFRLDNKPFTTNDPDFYCTSAYADYAIEFLEEGAQNHPNKPFFMYLAHTAPHAPLYAPEEDIALFADSYTKGWDVLRNERIERQKALGIIDENWQIPERPETKIPGWEELTQEEKQEEYERMAIYAAMVYRMDASIGRVINKLDELGLKDNTLIIFMSDNGASPKDNGRIGLLSYKNNNHGLGWAYLSNTPFRLYKRNMHQGGSCTSAIFYWKDKIENEGAIVDDVGHIVDLGATFIDIANTNYPDKYKKNSNLKPLPGKSLLPILQGGTINNRGTIYSQLFDNAYVIEDNWKMVKAFNEPWELYNLNTDRAETNNLAGTNNEKLSELKTKWNKWFSGKLTNKGYEPVYVHSNGEAYEYTPNQINTTEKNLPIVRLYPNPACSQINITVEGDNTALFTIINSNQKIVLQKELGHKTNYIDIDFLQAGNYIAVVEVEGKKTYKRFVKL